MCFNKLFDCSFVYHIKTEDIDNIRYYNASKELKQVLDNTKPIYNV